VVKIKMKESFKRKWAMQNSLSKAINVADTVLQATEIATKGKLSKAASLMRELLSIFTKKDQK